MKAPSAMLVILLLGATITGWAAEAPAEEVGFEAELAAIQRALALAPYQIPNEVERRRAFEELITRASRLYAAYPQRPQALTLKGVVLGNYAQDKSSVGALVADEARAVLERAIELDPDGLQGAAQASLGALYAKSNAFPFGFGNRRTARRYLDRALQINPTSMDTLYFLADFYFHDEQLEDARRYLERGLDAPNRPGLEVADLGRRRELYSLLGLIEFKKWFGDVLRSNY